MNVSVEAAGTQVVLMPGCTRWVLSRTESVSVGPCRRRSRGPGNEPWLHDRGIVLTHAMLMLGVAAALVRCGGVGLDAVSNDPQDYTDGVG
jgi:hypothetical protein